jgi:phosphate-selective porin OprO/OprP
VKQTGSAANTLLTAYKTETQRNFFSYDGARSAAGAVGVAAATIADGRRLRLSPQAYYYLGSFGLLSEYVRESQDVARTFGSGGSALTRRATLHPYSWQVLATYLLTGDTAAFGTVTPLRPFAVGQPGWGALELAARVSALQLDSATFASLPGLPARWFADPSAEPNKATAWTLGLNWYLTANVGWYLDYTATHFDGGAPAGANRSNEEAFFTRFQVAF